MYLIIKKTKKTKTKKLISLQIRCNLYSNSYYYRCPLGGHLNGEGWQ